MAQVSAVAGGTLGAQVLLTITSPILTRLYSPNDFGALMVYTSVVSLLIVVATLRYEAAIPLPKDDCEAANLTVLALCINVGTTIACAGLVAAGGDWLVRYSDYSIEKPLTWLIPFSVLSAGIYQVLNNWATRKQTFGLVGRTRLNQAFGQLVTQVGLGLARLGPVGLLLGSDVGRFGGSGTLLKSVFATDLPVFRQVTLGGMKQVALRYYRFPCYSSWSALLNSASLQVPVLTMSNLFGTDVTGWFGLSYRVLQVPLTFVGQAVSQVFFSKAAESHRQGTLQESTWRTFRYLAVLGVGPITLLGLLGPDLFDIAFGDFWRPAGVYTQWLCPWLLLVFVTSPLTSLVYVLEKQKYELAFQTATLLGRLSALYVGARMGGASLAIGLYSIVSTALWLGYACWLLLAAGIPVLKPIRFLFTEISVALVIIALPGIVISLDGAEWLVWTSIAASVSLMLWRSVRSFRKVDIER